MKHKKNVIFSGLILSGIILAGCSSETNTPTPTEVTLSPETTYEVTLSAAETLLTETELKAFRDISHPDEDRMVVTYDYDISKIYSQELVDNFEKDANNLTHALNDGYFLEYEEDGTFNTGSTLKNLQPLMTPGAYSVLVEGIKNDTEESSDYLVRAIDNQGGIAGPEGKVYKIKERTVDNEHGDVIVEQLSETGNISYTRWINIDYLTEDDEIFKEVSKISYSLTPSSSGEYWQINGWNRDIESFELLEN